MNLILTVKTPFKSHLRLLRIVLSIAFVTGLIFFTDFILLNILVAVFAGLVFVFSALKLSIELNQQGNQLIWKIASPLNIVYKRQKYRKINSVTLEKRDFVHDPSYWKGKPPTHYDFHLLITDENDREGRFFLKTVRLADHLYGEGTWDKTSVLKEGRRISDLMGVAFINDVKGWT